MSCKFLCVTLFLLPLSALADESHCDSSLNLVTTNIPPIVNVENGKIKGALIDTVKGIMADNFEYVEIKHTNWARALQLAKQGKIDGIFPTMYSDERNQYLDFSLAAISQVSLMLYSNSKKNLEFSQINADHIVAVPRSINFDKKIMNDATIVEVGKFEHAVKMLEIGRVDYVVGVTKIVEKLINDKHIKHIQESYPLGTFPIYVAFSKNSSNYKNIITCINEK